MGSTKLEQNIERLIPYANIDTIVKVIDFGDGISSNIIDLLLENGANIKLVIERMDYEDIISNLEILLKYSDIKFVAESLYNIHRIEIVDVLKESPTIKSICNGNINDEIRFLLDCGIDADIVLKIAPDRYVISHFETFMKAGADMSNFIVCRMHQYEIVSILPYVKDNPKYLNLATERLYGEDITKNFDFLLKHGADVNAIVRKIGNKDLLTENFDLLIKKGANINLLCDNLYSSEVISRLDFFLEHGVDTKTLFSNMSWENIFKNLEVFSRYGISINEIVRKKDSLNLIKYLDVLLEYGASPNIIIFYMSPKEIIDHLDLLLKYGASKEKIAQIISGEYLIEYLDVFLEHGFGAKLIAKHLKS